MSSSSGALTQRGIPKIFRNIETSNSYEILEQIGSGATAVVCKCRLLSTGEIFAVKVIDLQPAAMMSDLKRIRQKLRNEVAILRQMYHPCIVNLLEVVETEQHMFLVLEYVSNGELFHKITK